jgi:hypothetical protein
MTDFDAIYVEDVSEDVPIEHKDSNAIFIRGIGEITM